MTASSVTEVLEPPVPPPRNQANTNLNAEPHVILENNINFEDPQHRERPLSRAFSGQSGIDYPAPPPFSPNTMRRVSNDDQKFPNKPHSPVDSIIKHVKPPPDEPDETDEEQQIRYQKLSNEIQCFFFPQRFTPLRNCFFVKKTENNLFQDLQHNQFSEV